ncbi:MAG: 3-deoxy-7-phosphoheptulonate synthase [Actinobacteria bacterium]|nr:3-deoxy-7-phosphoheptulonate synthase [Actinomycetota bacterium]
MVVVMKPSASEAEVEQVVARVREAGGEAFVSPGKYRTIIGLVGDTDRFMELPLSQMPGVEQVIRVGKPYKMVARELHPEPSAVKVGPHSIDRRSVTVIAGPCAVESLEQTLEAARMAKRAGAHILRGGAYKPRTSPYSFQGLAKEGLEILAACREETGLPVVTEVLEARDVDLVVSLADALQIGARNMQNFSLLKEVGKATIPVILKRGLSATVEEWLMAAEYVAREGNMDIVLCERGIRTFETATRNTLDLAGMAVARDATHLPVIVDPSHATGVRELVGPMARAAVAAGADGIMVEIHPHPQAALSDGPQALTGNDLDKLVEELASVGATLGKPVPGYKKATSDPGMGWASKR